ncbi:HAD hydrolase-like protein [Candidatus Saccharibacteria bacterium]|nr:HAD hydrolase-like protein [Candidatus Saccharibacteria bacterium]
MTEPPPDPLREVGRFAKRIKRRHPGKTALGALGVNQIGDGIRQLREQDWSEMNHDDRVAFVEAQFMSVAHVVAQAIIEKKLCQNDSGWTKTGADAMTASLDFFDGYRIRQRDHVDGTLGALPNTLKTINNAKTALGGGVDEKMDKLGFLVEEIGMAIRGELPWSQVTIRAIRDLTMNLVRDAVHETTGGKVDVSARDFRAALRTRDYSEALGSGKVSTALRSASNKLLKSPLGEEMPETLKRIITWLVTAEVGYTAVRSITAYAKATNRFFDEESAAEPAEVEPTETEPPEVKPADFWRNDMKTVDRTDHAVISSIVNLTPKDLELRHIELLAIDIDNTLISYHKEKVGEVKPGIVAKLIELSQAGIKLVLASNTKNPGRLVDLIEQLNRRASEQLDDDNFSLITGAVVPASAINFSGEDGGKKDHRAKPDKWEELVASASEAGAQLWSGGHSKPWPDIFTIAAQMSNVDPAYAAAIGDQLLKDIDGAKRAGYQLAIETAPFGKEHPGVHYLQRPFEALRRLGRKALSPNSYPDELTYPSSQTSSR